MYLSISFSCFILSIYFPFRLQWMQSKVQPIPFGTGCYFKTQASRIVEKCLPDPLKQSGCKCAKCYHPKHTCCRVWRDPNYPLPKFSKHWAKSWVDQAGLQKNMGRLISHAGNTPFCQGRTSERSPARQGPLVAPLGVGLPVAPLGALAQLPCGPEANGTNLRSWAQITEGSSDAQLPARNIRSRSCFQAISHRSLELLSFCWGNR